MTSWSGSSRRIKIYSLVLQSEECWARSGQEAEEVLIPPPSAVALEPCPSLCSPCSPAPLHHSPCSSAPLLLSPCSPAPLHRSPCSPAPLRHSLCSPALYLRALPNKALHLLTVHPIQCPSRLRNASPSHKSLPLKSLWMPQTVPSFVSCLLSSSCIIMRCLLVLSPD